jgi:hypothetical protein
MPIDDPEPNGNPAIAYLIKQRDAYASTLKRLEAQFKGVEAKMLSTRAKLEATEEALNALAPKSGSAADPKP